MQQADRQNLKDCLDLIGVIGTMLAQVQVRVSLVVGEKIGPILSDRDRIRVAKLGEMAHLHLEFLEKHGMMTIRDSREIRRRLTHSVKEMRSTTNLFGKPGSNSILCREDHTKRTEKGDQVLITSEGRRIAELWRELNGVAA
jgi:hypothetical protein